MTAGSGRVAELLRACVLGEALRQVNGDGTVVCQGVQQPISGSCSFGEAIREVNADGTVSCEPIVQPVPPPLVALSSITQLGVMKVTGTFMFTQHNVAHGVVDHNKVLSVSMYIIDDEGQHFPPASQSLLGNTGNDGREYYFKVRVLQDTFQITIQGHATNNHGNIMRSDCGGLLPCPCTTAPCGNFVITILYDAA